MSECTRESEADNGPPTTASAAKVRLDRLLSRLAEGGGGAPDYERLHTRLTTFFRLRFPAQAEALADESLDRLARRITEGVVVDNLASYALGIARLVVLETNALEQKRRLAAHEAQLAAESEQPDDDLQSVLAALRECLNGAGRDAAHLILEYYAVDDGASRILQRQRLAQHLGLNLNALRNRALRIRLSLEKCVGRRLAPAAVGERP